MYNLELQTTGLEMDLLPPNAPQTSELISASYSWLCWDIDWTEFPAYSSIDITKPSIAASFPPNVVALSISKYITKT